MNQREEAMDQEEKSQRKKFDYEPQIGGISLKQTSPFVKTLYTVGVVASIVIIFFIGTTTLNPFF